MLGAARDAVVHQCKLRPLALPTACSLSLESVPRSTTDSVLLSQEDDGIETWMLLEYCDRGSLQRAIERGKLNSRSGEGGPDMVRLKAQAPSALMPRVEQKCADMLASETAMCNVCCCCEECSAVGGLDVVWEHTFQCAPARTCRCTF